MSSTTKKRTRPTAPIIWAWDGFFALPRRTWDLNPRGFHLPVFKTGALGRYASPPWERLPEFEYF